MIQGFGTREITDQIIRAFVKSANGIMHEKQKVVGQYEQTVWPTFKEIDSPVAVILCTFFPKYKYLFIAIAILSSLSRVVLSAHWLSDIVIGAVFGITIPILIIKKYKDKF